MIPKEIKQLIELSGGKVIISEGDLEDSYVVAKLGEYLKEMEGRKGKIQESQGEIAMDVIAKDLGVDEEREEGLTNKDDLDKINTDIASLHSREVEEEVDESFESKDEDDNIRYESVR